MDPQHGPAMTPSSGSPWAAPAPAPYSGPPAAYPPPYGYPMPGGPYPPPGPYPQGPYPYPYPPPPHPGMGGPQPPRPVRVDAVPGTGFGVAYPGVDPTVSGLSIGAMIGGIGSVLVAVLVFCFGLAGAQAGWGALVSGAFAVLAGLVGAAALTTGILARRQIRRAGGALSGKGMSVAGIACGASGLGLTVIGFVLALVTTLSG